MSEDFEKHFEERDIFGILTRYQDMLKHSRSSFFDLFEFEEIIDYYFENQEYSCALEANMIALMQYPFAVSLKLRHSKILCEKNRIPAALQILQEIEMLESYNPEIHLVKGKVLNKSGKQREAINEFDKAIRLASENRDEIILFIARAFLETGDDGLAIKYLLLAHETDDRNLLVLYELASCYEHLENYDKTIEILQKYLDIDPFAEKVWFSLGVSYAKLGKNKEALDALEYAYTINDRYISVYYSKAELLNKTGRFNEAVSVYKELLQIDPENARLFCLIGDCYTKSGDMDQALNCFRQAKRIENHCPEAWYGMAVVYKKMAKLHHSLINIRKAIRLDPENDEYWLFLGELYTEMQMNENAMKAFSKAIEINPSDYEAWLAYARIYYKENKVTDAIEVLNRAYQYNYDISTVNYQLAAYHTVARQYSDAARYFEKGLHLNYSEHQDYLNQFEEHFDKETIRRILSKFQK
ncbi:MAG: tetratricopeptide repeat protein [Bacteroidales bacterium]|nr:tetratricopeptide repeat protein [Bacteroidales bacterium]